MFSSFLSPFFRSPYAFGGINQGIGFIPGVGYGFGGLNPFFGGFGSNIIGSAIANQSVVNTGSIIGFTQTATPTVIW